MRALFRSSLFLLLAGLEWVRSRILVRVGAQFDAALNSRVFNAAFETNLRTNGANAGQAIAIDKVVDAKAASLGGGQFDVVSGAQRLDERGVQLVRRRVGAIIEPIRAPGASGSPGCRSSSPSMLLSVVRFMYALDRPPKDEELPRPSSGSARKMPPPVSSGSPSGE